MKKQQSDGADNPQRLDMKMALSAREILEIDEILADQEGTERAMQIAFTFAINSLRELRRREKKWWDDVLARRGQTREDCEWIIDRTTPILYIAPVPREE